MLRHIDASAAIDLWTTYPIAQFPLLWKWVESEFSRKDMAISRIALEETGFRIPDCRANIESFGVTGLQIGNDEVLEALAIKSLLGIVNDEYGSGVDENDILIIASAKVQHAQLVTNEALQPKLPASPRNYKMPAVCGLPAIQVPCCRLIDWIMQSGMVFG